MVYLSMGMVGIGTCLGSMCTMYNPKDAHTDSQGSLGIPYTHYTLFLQNCLLAPSNQSHCSSKWLL